MTGSRWAPVRDALKSCRAAGVAVPFWWRDDDATEPSKALDTLVALADDLQLPVHLAVIPAHASQALPQRCAGAPLIPVVHGWAHADHAAAGDKKNEFQTPRTDAVQDTGRALRRMQVLFGPALRPMFVPPWNRVHPEVVAGLAAQGYHALSTFGPRGAVDAAPGLAQINTHVDPIWWKGTRGLADPETLVEQTATLLHDRAAGRADATEPLGLLTHHLVHDGAIWDFTRAFLSEMLEGGADPWTMENPE